MARVTVEDCLENVENRFELVLLATKRARQLQRGSDKPRVTVRHNYDKPSVIALREISEAKITKEILAAEEKERAALAEAAETREAVNAAVMAANQKPQSDMDAASS